MVARDPYLLVSSLYEASLKYEYDLIYKDNLKYETTLNMNNLKYAKLSPGPILAGLR